MVLGDSRSSSGVSAFLSPTPVSVATMASDIEWLSTAEAAGRLGITPRTLYRFLDEGQLPGYRFGRVIRLQATDVETFIEHSRIEPGTLEHLYPDPSPRAAATADDDA
jgi:excisionase family DNA binding protein